MSIGWGKAVKINAQPVSRSSVAVTSTLGVGVISFPSVNPATPIPQRELSEVGEASHPNQPNRSVLESQKNRDDPQAGGIHLTAPVEVKFRDGIDPCVRIEIPGDEKMAKKIEILASYIAIDGDPLEKVSRHKKLMTSIYADCT